MPILPATATVKVKSHLDHLSRSRALFDRLKMPFVDERSGKRRRQLRVNAGTDFDRRSVPPLLFECLRVWEVAA